LNKHHQYQPKPHDSDPADKDFQLQRFSVIKLGRVRFKVKDLVWTAGRGTADMLRDEA
jgi:hypothetical protein